MLKIVVVGENDDSSSEGLTHEQQPVASGSIICENLLIVEIVVESLPSFFLSVNEGKNEWIIPHLSSLSFGCILAITLPVFY